MKVKGFLTVFGFSIYDVPNLAHKGTVEYQVLLKRKTIFLVKNFAQAQVSVVKVKHFKGHKYRKEI